MSSPSIYNLRTPLAPLQEDLGAKFVDFGGWDLPVLYSSVMEETEAVRNACGIFDVSHMGRFFVSGEDAQEQLNRILSRELSSQKIGRQRYSLLLNDEGFILDDLMVARIGETEFLVVVNAGTLESDRQWLEDRLTGDAVLVDRSAETLMIAVQGPEAEKVLAQSSGCDLSDMKFLDVMETNFAGVPFLVSRSGYTGSDGFEIGIPIQGGIELWVELLEAGAKPCGLGARDLLRLEMAYPLYGHELSRELRPHECGLEWALSKKGDFIGKAAIEKNPPNTELVGFVLEKKSIPRQGCLVEVNGKEVGSVTSGGLSSRLPNGFGLARVAKDSIRDSLDIVIRDKRVPAKRVETPFIKDGLKR
jgi:aminomethyltransferase